MGETNLQPQYLKDSNGNRIAPITTIEAVKLTDDLNLTDVLDDFGASGDMHKSGFVPDPGSTSGNSKALYEDGTWKDTYTKTESDNKYATKTDISSLATVAISGSYNDLSDKPTISAAQVNSDWNASSGVAEILHKPTIPTKVSDLTNDAGYTTNTGTITSVKMNGSTIASSGEADLGTVITSHQDISGKANKSEMSVIDGTGTDADKTTITLKSGTSATVLKSHQSLSSKQDVIDSSHKLSADLVDDTNSTHKFVSSQEKTTWNNKSDFSGSYNDLTDKPTIPAAQVQSDWNATSGMGEILNKPTIPTVPTNVSAFTNDAGYLTSHQDISGKEDKITIDSTTKQTSFTATVGNYYNVSISANSSITITLDEQASTFGSCIFRVNTSSNPSLTIASNHTVYFAENYEIEDYSIYEINALWNGANWYITSVKFNIPSID